MESIIKVTSRVLFPIIMLFGIYIGLYGHLSPGGAFPAGVILASAFAILILAHEKEDPEHMVLKKMFNLRVVGFLLIVMFALHNIGYIFGHDIIRTQKFLELWSGGHSIFFNNLSMILIFSTFSMIVYLMVKQ